MTVAIMYIFRRILLNLLAMNKKQPEWVPKFTEVGFEVVPIPAAVYAALVADHRRLEAGRSAESCPRGVINCEVISSNDDIQESTLREEHRTFMMTPRYLSNRTIFPLLDVSFSVDR